MGYRHAIRLRFFCLVHIGEKSRKSGVYLKPSFMLTLTYPYLHFGSLPFWSSSILVVFHFGRLPFWSSPFWSSSILVVFLFGRLSFFFFFFFFFFSSSSSFLPSPFFLPLFFLLFFFFPSFFLSPPLNFGPDRIPGPTIWGGHGPPG